MRWTDHRWRPFPFSFDILAMATSGVNPTPRVNKGFMQLYKNQVVRVVCRVKAINGTVLEVKLSPSNFRTHFVTKLPCGTPVADFSNSSKAL